MSIFNWDRVWQVGCGTGSRDYREVFFTYGLMAMGARGDEGPFDEDLRPYDNPQRWQDASRKIRTVAVDMDLGDTIVLKYGKSIVGIGRVIGEYYYDDYQDWKVRFKQELEEATPDDPYIDIPFEETRLDDVDGWDLRHTRRVEWWAGSDLPCDTLSRGACDRVYSSKTINKAKRFLKKAKKISHSKKLPDPAGALTNDEIIEHLMNYGISSARSEELSNRLQTLQRLADWYYYVSADISEHEIRAYLVWPLLQVLGWSEQCVKFEWKNLDLALMKLPYTDDTKKQIPVIIGETKRMFSGLIKAGNQAEDYANVQGCNSVLITDGVRYMIHEKDEKGSRNSMYMNLLKLRDRHPYWDNIKGADELLTRLIK